MEILVHFYRDILDGPLYIIVAIISGILICSCIGYLAETSINKKKKILSNDSSIGQINQNTATVNVSQPSNISQNTQLVNNMNVAQDSVGVSVTNGQNINQNMQPQTNVGIPEMDTINQVESANITQNINK